LYLFSLIWSFGALLDEPDRKKFSELLLSLTTALPDYDQEISVFDYYVDESGEWDPWQSRLVKGAKSRYFKNKKICPHINERPQIMV